MKLLHRKRNFYIERSMNFMNSSKLLYKDVTAEIWDRVASATDMCSWSECSRAGYL